ncbi:MAG: hypothetical protein QGG53_01195 [Planctomycetota bacterium]|nr:hypothetical protein [Planctomycetota bacterium]
MDLGATIIALFTVLVVKVMVMFLGARMVLRLYRATYEEPPKRLWILLPQEHVPEIKLLWWSLVLFFVGEFTCGIEVYILLRSSSVLAAMHSVVSGTGTALFALGAYIYLDRKIIRYGERGCVVNRICQGCTFREKEGCKFLLVALLFASFVVLAGVLPFFVPTERMVANTRQFILPFESVNVWFDTVVDPWLAANFASYDRSGIAYYLPSSMFVIEFRILPAIALTLALAGIFLLRTQREVLGLRLTVFAFGILAYTYLEILLYPATKNVLMGSLGHETAELWFLVITAEFLRRSFSPTDKPNLETAS